MALKLAKAGYYGGDPERVGKGRVDIVLKAVQYEGFLNEYEETYIIMNRKGK